MSLSLSAIIKNHTTFSHLESEGSYGLASDLLYKYYKEKSDLEKITLFLSNTLLRKKNMKYQKYNPKPFKMCHLPGFTNKNARNYAKLILFSLNI